MKYNFYTLSLTHSLHSRSRLHSMPGFG